MAGFTLGQLIAKKTTEDKPATPAVSTPPAQVSQSPAKTGGLSLGNLVKKVETPAMVPQKSEPTAPAIGLAMASKSLMADALAAANKLKNESSPATQSNPVGHLDPVNCDHDGIRLKIQELLEYQLQEHPMMPRLLVEIHSVLVKRADIVGVLSDDEIGIIVGGLAKAQNVILAQQSAAKAKGKRIPKNISADDI